MGLFKEIISLSDNNYINGLVPELRALYVYNLFEQKKENIIVVASSLFEANKMYTLISDFTSDVLFFPMDDFLTSEALAVSPELKIKRLETLNELISSNKKIVVTNLMGYLRFLPKKKDYEDSILKLEVNKDYKNEELVKRLFNLGYEKEVVVNKTGEIAVRGFVVDIFPISAPNPIRIEFWGDTIDSIREFDVNTQLTLNKLDSIVINPNTEFLVNKEVPFEEYKQKYLPKYVSVSNIKDYLDNSLVVFDDYSALKVNYDLLVDEMFNYSLSNDEKGMKYMFSLEELTSIRELYFLSFDNVVNDNLDAFVYTSSEVEPFSGNALQINNRLNDYINKNKKVIICLNSRYHVNKLLEELENDKLVFTDLDNIVPNKINLVIKTLQYGFIFGDYVVISENEIFNKKDTNYKYKTNFKMGTKIRDINKLNPGDYIVHSAYGIGQYVGLKTLTKNGLKKDYLEIVYRDQDKLYIPVEKLELISKYSSNEGLKPKLNKLGSSEWEKTKLRVRKKIEDIAGELLELYAKREATSGFAFSKDDENQLDFEKEFSYSETVDQLKVTEEIKKDMESPHPMDRLLCGDVGFGKTEVAFRAMMKAVLSGKQVAFLCPTTILSSQNYNNAIERFKSFAVNIALLNRFTTPKKTKEIIEGLKQGTIDIVIGTHRILSDDINFKDLGLLVIDEEQRFGVKHKEKIKQYKNNIDVLTLSATPIPRTLQMSMTGVRSLSLIETAPTNRYPVQTYVLAENKEVIRDAIYKELSRDGQVFILYNYIDDMDKKQAELERLVPDAKIVTAHGRMDKTEIEDVMMKFTNHEYDVLLCTTIIETGIDIPNVNTLIIMDADRFGLSQLYQIRGRVGRGERIAYCYLMYDKHKVLSEIATKRLKVIKDFTELGSGFAIAMRDLSIRGAGDILGSEQAGFVDSVGIELYLTMLNEEVAKLKGEKTESNENESSQPLVDVETSIKDNYVYDDELKIEIHKKINSIDSKDKLEQVRRELEDRFGTIDEEMLVYMHEEYFEKLAHSLGINKIKQTKNFIEVELSKQLTELIDGEVLFEKVTDISRMFRFTMRFGRLSIILDTVKLDKHFIYYLIDLMEALKESLKK